MTESFLDQFGLSDTRADSGKDAKIHPAANLFPMMDAEAYERLKEDIEANGQREDIVFFDGQIIDGRNRHKACIELGVDPYCVELEECEDPVAYVLSLNLHRRHLTEAQRSMVAARAKGYYAAEAKKRQKEAGKTHGRGQQKVVENLPQPINGKARDQAGAALGVSGSPVLLACEHGGWRCPVCRPPASEGVRRAVASFYDWWNGRRGE